MNGFPWSNSPTLAMKSNETGPKDLFYTMKPATIKTLA